MRSLSIAVLGIVLPILLPAQTAEELVNKNLQARGGIDKIKAIKTLRMTGKIQQGSFTAQFSQLAIAPNLVREALTVQGMSQIQAYDGATGWQINPFEGRKDAELLGEDDLRELVEEADFYGPLVDYKTKDNRIEYASLTAKKLPPLRVIPEDEWVKSQAQQDTGGNPPGQPPFRKFSLGSIF